MHASTHTLLFVPHCLSSKGSFFDTQLNWLLLSILCVCISVCAPDGGIMTLMSNRGSLLLSGFSSFSFSPFFRSLNFLINYRSFRLASTPPQNTLIFPLRSYSLWLSSHFCSFAPSPFISPPLRSLSHVSSPFLPSHRIVLHLPSPSLESSKISHSCPPPITYSLITDSLHISFLHMYSPIPSMLFII